MIKNKQNNESENNDNEKYFLKEFLEAIKWRFFTPLYFYFTTSLIFINWKFFYTLLFVDQKLLLLKTWFLKVNYLSWMYNFHLFSTWLKLFILPFLSAFLFIFVFHWVSIKFYRRHKMNKIAEDEVDKNVSIIDRENKYFKKLKDWWNKKEEDKKNNKNEIEYWKNEIFNSWIDNEEEQVKILDWFYNKSELLYNTEYNQYVSWLKIFEEDKKDKINSLINSWSFQNTHSAVSYLEEFRNFLSDNEVIIIIKALKENSQIIPDDNVKDFIYGVIENMENKLDKELEKKVYEWSWDKKNENKIKVEDLPF